MVEMIDKLTKYRSDGSKGLMSDYYFVLDGAILDVKRTFIVIRQS